MKKIELRKLIKEEIKKLVTENVNLNLGDNANTRLTYNEGASYCVLNQYNSDDNKHDSIVIILDDIQLFTSALNKLQPTNEDFDKEKIVQRSIITRLTDASTYLEYIKQTPALEQFSNEANAIIININNLLEKLRVIVK